MLSDLDKAYFGGLFDGEGCVRVNKNKNRTLNSGSVDVAINMTDAEPLCKLYAEYGGTLTVRKNYHKKFKCFDLYCWRVRANNLERFLEDILPFSRVKKKQIELALAFRKIINSKTSKFSNKISEVDSKARIYLLNKITEEKYIKEEVDLNKVKGTN